MNWKKICYNQSSYCDSRNEMSYKNLQVFSEMVFNFNESTNKELSLSELNNVLNTLDMRTLEVHGVNKYPLMVMEALQQNNYQKAKTKLEKLMKKSYNLANDNPVGVGKDVWLVRSEHGWYDGTRKAKVVSRSQSKNGVWSYCVKMYDENDVLSSYEETVNHTRDMYLCV